MALIVEMKAVMAVRHLYWKADRRKFITLCDDGSVIFNGKVMTLAQVTSRLLKEEGVPPRFFWEP